MYFRNYRLGKPWLDKCLKSHFSENPSKSNMVRASKHFKSEPQNPWHIY